MIVGCGASAVILLAALTAHYAVANAPLLTITIIDDNPVAPRGLAYGCFHPSFILNVPAQRMGVYADNPAHFYQWLQQTNAWRHLHPDFATLQFEPDDFVPRMIYGEYLTQIFNDAILRLNQAGHKIEKIVERVIAVKSVGNQQLRVSTDQQKQVVADVLVMATGNHPAFHNESFSHSIFASPYAATVNQCDWQQQRDLVLIGSGLGMVDAVQMVTAQGYTGRFHVFSRHSLLPLPHHHVHSPCNVPSFQSSARSSAALLRDIRAYLKANAMQGVAWQDSINQLRACNNYLWSNLAEIERNRMRRFLPWWNIARHRIPVEIARHLDTLRAEGRLRTYKANVKRIDVMGNGFQITVHDKKTVADPQKIKVIADKVLLCAGYFPGFQSVQSLCQGLLNAGNQLRAELGKPKQTFRLSANYEIYGVGPALGGVLFETTAIQEIRQQAQVIAGAIYETKLRVNPTNAHTTMTLITPAL